MESRSSTVFSGVAWTSFASSSSSWAFCASRCAASRRFEAARAERRRLGEADYPLDEEFLRLLQFMPPTGGVALGVDRLVMLAVGANTIDAVRVVGD